MDTKQWNKEREARKEKWVARLENWGNKAHSVFWILAAVYVLYQTNFFYVAWTSAASSTFFLGSTCVLLGLFGALVVYGSFFLPTDEDVEVVSPSLLPMASAVGGLLFLSSLAAFWPIWGWLTPVIMTVLHFGFVKAGTSFPNSRWGSAATIGVFVAAGVSAGFIPHEGLWQ